MAELEAHIRKTAEEMIEKLQIEHAQSESRGVKKEVIFLEYMSAVPEHQAYLNPKATICCASVSTAPLPFHWSSCVCGCCICVCVSRVDCELTQMYESHCCVECFCVLVCDVLN